MAKNVFIQRWHRYSKGAIDLGDAINARNLKFQNSAFTPSADKTLVNWGCSEIDPKIIGNCKVINDPSLVRVASDKISFFNKMQKSARPPRLPEFTTDVSVALEWAAKGDTVVARTLTRSSGAKGMVFLTAEDVDTFVKAPLYTKYKKKKEEFRVHFAFGKVIDVQRKALRKTDDAGNPIDPETIDTRVRNLANGYIFARNDIEVPPDVYTQAELAYIASELDFGAVDVIYNEHEKQAYVLEINSAPGLEGTTLTNYAAAFEAAL